MLTVKCHILNPKVTVKYHYNGASIVLFVVLYYRTSTVPVPNPTISIAKATANILYTSLSTSKQKRGGQRAHWEQA
jgi:hypothetical protein